MTTNMFKNIMTDFYTKENLKNFEFYKKDFKCCHETFSFKKYSGIYSSFGTSIYFLCSNNNCEYGNNYGIEKIGNDNYIFWYDNKNFYYVKLPLMSSITEKIKKDTRNVWNSMYKSLITEKNKISKELEDFLRKSAHKHIENETTDQSTIENIFTLFLIKEELNKYILELEEGKMIEIKFTIETDIISMKLCNEYKFKCGEYDFMDCLFIPLKNEKYIYEHTTNYFPKTEKIMLELPFGKLNVKKDNI